jgi:predicted flap endonuclease-1-like 5' DNA nuclease
VLAYNCALCRQPATRNAFRSFLPFVNGLTLLVVIALAIGIFIAYRAGALRGRRDATAELPLREIVTAPPAASAAKPPPIEVPAAASIAVAAQETQVAAEKARLIRSMVAENAALRRSSATSDAQLRQLAAFAEDRRGLLRELAQTRADVARYRDIVVDIETNAPPTLLTGTDTFDDLKLIVGVGPVLERLLHRLGVTTYRQIARWSERDVDEFDAKLPEFPGRIRRDGWVNQARELHLAKYGEPPPAR